MYSSVPTMRAVLREQRPLGQLLLGRLGHAEVDHLGHRLAVVERDHHVGRLDVAVDDPLLVGVLDRLADRHEQLQPLARRQVVVVAVLGDRHAVDQLHDEVRAAGFRGPGVEDAGDVDVVHHRQGLPLGLEPGDDLATVHARLDDLERDLALHGVRLLGHVDGAHAPFADLLQQLVRADLRAGGFARDEAAVSSSGLRSNVPVAPGATGRSRKLPARSMFVEQVAPAARGAAAVSRAGPVQERGPFRQGRGSPSLR